MCEPAQTTDSAQCIPTPSASPDLLQLSQSLPLDWEQDPSCGLTRSSISLGQKSLLFSFSSSQVSLCAGVMVALNQELLCCLMWGRTVQGWCWGALSRTVGSQELGFLKDQVTSWPVLKQSRALNLPFYFGADFQ